VIFIEWWEIALFASFWGLETRRIARIRDEKLKEPDPDRGPLKEPYRTTDGEQSSKAETIERQNATAAQDAEQELSTPGSGSAT
jgi:hypothetical protein